MVVWVNWGEEWKRLWKINRYGVFSLEKWKSCGEDVDKFVEYCACKLFSFKNNENNIINVWI